LTAEYGGTPLANFPPPEQRDDEFFVEAAINQASDHFTEIKALLNNRSSWPARLIKDLSYNYYMDLTEVFEAGYSVDDIKVTIGYCESGMDVEISPITHLYDNIYYIKISYIDGTNICPIGQEQYAAELQFRIAAPQGTKFWDPTMTSHIRDLPESWQRQIYARFDGATKIFGEVPGGFEPVPSPSPTPAQYKVGDLNGDGVVNSTDSVILKRHIIKFSEITDPVK